MSLVAFEVVVIGDVPLEDFQQVNWTFTDTGRWCLDYLPTRTRTNSFAKRDCS